MQSNKFTILIPTRERCDTLYHTIRTCLNQTYQNLEIIVSDNFSQDNTRNVVMSFNDSRLKYINTGKRLSMSENFDFALSHTYDGYIMFIGDDDGLFPNSLEYVNDAINETKCEAIVSLNAFYSWPKTMSPNKLTWSPKVGYEIRNSKEWIRKYFTFRMEYTFDLPGAYCGFVKRNIFDKVKKGESFFRSSTPDAYSALAVSFAIDNYVYSYTPFVVHGSSPRSNGGAYLSAAKNEEGLESKLFIKENKIPFHHDIVMTKAFRVSSLEAFLQFSDIFPELTKDYVVNWFTFLRFVLIERKQNTKEEIETAVKEMCAIHQLDYNKVLSSAPNLFTGLSLKDITNKVFSRLLNIITKFLFKNKIYAIDDVTKFGVYNVYDAVLLLNFFLVKK